MNINESTGTPHIIREIISENLLDITNIIDSKKDNVLKLDINKSILIRNSIHTLMCKVRINFHFRNVDNYNGDVNFDECISSDFNDCRINIYLPMWANLNLFLKSLSHELTHIYELYQIRDIYDDTRWKQSKNLKKFDDLYEGFDKIIYFRNLFYTSLPHEIRSKVSSIGIYLGTLSTNNKDEIVNRLEELTEWNHYISLKNFNPVIYLEDLLNEFSEDILVTTFNYFNKLMDIDTRISNKGDILMYFKKTKKYFDVVCDRYGEKIFKIVNKLSNNVDSSEVLEKWTDSIISYGYFSIRRNNIIEDILYDIDYREFY